MQEIATKVTTGLDQITLFLQLIGVGVLAVSLGVIAVKYFVKKQRAIDDVIEGIIAAFVGSGLLFGAHAIASWFETMFK